jgi:AAA domain
VIYLPNPAVGARGLYAALVTGLGGIPRFHTASLIAQTMDHLAAEKHERGRAVIVAVDEAHLLSADQLEEMRLLTNSEMDSVAPFTGLLLGQPTLRRRIKLGSFAALDQRIMLRYSLPGMTEAETRDYLTHHLKLVGRSDQLFSDDAATLIHQTSRGLPRAVNNLALQALVATFAANKTIVDESAARAAITEVTAESVVLSEPGHRPATRHPDLLEDRRRRDRIAQMLGQETHHLAAHLQVRHIDVEIDPIQTLQIQRHMPIEDVVYRHRVDHEPQPGRNQAARPATTSAVRGEASLGCR